MSVARFRTGFGHVDVTGAGDRVERRRAAPEPTRVVVGSRSPPATPVARSRHIGEIVAALREYEYGLTSGDVAALCQINVGHVNQLLLTMRARGEVDYVGVVEEEGNIGGITRRRIVWRLSPRYGRAG